MDEKEFYAQHSEFTDPGDRRGLLRGLPDDIDSLCKIVRSVMVHRDETSRLFGLELSEQRYREGETRHIRDILVLLDDLRERPVEHRFAGTCRDFTLLLCALLREVGVPARLRGGFASYLEPPQEGHWPFDDHWAVEYWCDGHGWRLADPQMWGEEARNAYRADFDVTDVPRDQFLVAGQAWLMCRDGERDPRTIGASALNQTGMWIMQGTLVRDLAALHRAEAFPWETWGIMTCPFPELTELDFDALDRAAVLGVDGGPVEQIEVLYGRYPELRATGLDRPSRPHRPEVASHVPLEANRLALRSASGQATEQLLHTVRKVGG